MPLKPAAYYGNLAALKEKCPPGSSQAKFYTSIAEIVESMLKDADVSPVGVTPMSNAGGPVAGLGRIRVNGDVAP